MFYKFSLKMTTKRISFVLCILSALSDIHVLLTSSSNPLNQWSIQTFIAVFTKDFCNSSRCFYILLASKIFFWCLLSNVSLVTQTTSFVTNTIFLFDRFLNEIANWLR